MINSSLLFANDDSNHFHSFMAVNQLTAFKEKTPGVVELGITMRLNFRDTVPGVLKSLTEHLDRPVISFDTPNAMTIETSSLLIDVSTYDHRTPFQTIPRTFSIQVFGRAVALEQFSKHMEKYVHTDETYVYWWFKTGDEMGSYQFTLEDNGRPFCADHYPFIPDVENFAQRYIDSQANVLVLLGEPGLGKTSLIRHILKHQKCESYITYDEAIMKDDQFYVKFLADSEAQFLVLEDADLLLSERVKDNNKIMSKILNASDGLISLRNKKIIFTANIHDKSKLDPALVRPGRCFDVVEFRELTYAESRVIADKNDIQLPERKEFTLAQIFQYK